VLQLVKDLTASMTDPCVENSTDILRYDYQYTVQNIPEEINVKRETVVWIQFNFYQKYHNRGVCAKMVLENLGAEKNT
jgi:hypothetical protein